MHRDEQVIKTFNESRTRMEQRRGPKPFDAHARETRDHGTPCRRIELTQPVVTAPTKAPAAGAA